MKYVFFAVIGILVFFYILGSDSGNQGGTNIDNRVSASNYDGTYTISYSDSKCGQLGYAFKLLHQRDGHSDTSKMHKSNCKINNEGDYTGYIYPKSRKNLRVFWVSNGDRVNYVKH